MTRNLCRTNCRICEGRVTLVGIPYKLTNTSYNEGMWIADATCTLCGTKYSAWIGPTADSYGTRQVDCALIRVHGFYDLSYRSTFNDEPGPDDIPTTPVEVFRVVRINGKETWEKQE